MLEVYHYPLCPFSRKLRIVLKEKFIGFELFYEPFWQRRKEFLRMNPSGSTPVIIKDSKLIIAGNQALFEYIEEVYGDNNLLGNTPEERLVIRRIVEWFDVKFYNEVTNYILNEKIIKTVSKTGAPNSQAIQAAKKNILYHLDYIDYLRGDNRYIAGDKPTLADFTAAAQLSVLDFVGDVPWQHNQNTKDWYALVKSRPSFKPLLLDKISNFHPPANYANPDF